MASRFSDSSLYCVAALVRWHLPARSLVRFKLVNKEWETWISQNLRELAKVRKQTPSDWYFPITAMSYGEGRAGAEVKPLAAIHHPSDEAHKLPDLDYLPNWRGGRSNPYSIKAVSGGLFLSYYNSSELSTSDFYVVNPLTRKWRKLSRGNCCHELGWDFLHAQMVVDENVGAYTVIVLTDNCLNVYSSHSKHWVCNPLRYSRGIHDPFLHDPFLPLCARSRFPASACVDGYVYVCSRILKERPRSVVEIQMFPIQPVAEQHPTRSPTIVALGNFRAYDIYLGRVYLNLASPLLVECMGGIYIVVCNCEIVETSQNTVPGVLAVGVLAVVMRRVIHIFKFQEGSKICPLHVHYVSERKLLIGSRIFSVVWNRRDKFSCTAKSSVIWVAWDNHLLQYDIVSSVWKDGDHFIDLFSSEDDKLLNQDYDLLPSAYTPSFDLSP
ncbi:hypothetical protein KC19_5G173200 [Ceratodon purpureus]|uniref:Uncharacterized protein n=1 Tax=Ceratodon purpureus TaxID=3225 RepID=A0A8T0I3L6_CERPU|nr:hypothetical protein KC19_5G173200 [Ceratodon purpureus]